MYFIPQAGQVKRASSSVCGPRCWPIRFCRIAGRFSSCLLTKCCCSAQLWHKCTSFLCESTMSVRCTVAGLEPQIWHFTPQFLFGFPFSVFGFRISVTTCLFSPKTENGKPKTELTLFELADAISDFGGFLVGFLVDCLKQLFAQLDQFGLRLLALRQAARSLAAMARLAVDVFQQRSEFVAKLLIIMRAAKPARVAEVHEL